MAGDIEAQHGLAVRLKVLGESGRLPSDLELTAFRIAQEGLNNVVQHAQATSASLIVEFGQEGSTLRLENSGVEFVIFCRFII